MDKIKAEVDVKNKEELMFFDAIIKTGLLNLDTESKKEFKEYKLDINYNFKKDHRIVSAGKIKNIMDSAKNNMDTSQLEQELYAIETTLIKGSRLGLSFTIVSGYISKEAETILKDCGYGVTYQSHEILDPYNKFAYYTRISWSE